MASAAGDSKSKPSSISRQSKVRFVVCVDSDGNDDLQVRRIYQSLPDSSAAKSRYIRVIDDSGEDYLYPESCFCLFTSPLKSETPLKVTSRRSPDTLRMANVRHICSRSAPRRARADSDAAADTNRAAVLRAR
jgi:hypothetical protein